MDTDPQPPPKGRPAGGTELSWCRAVPGGTGITVLAIHLSLPIDTSSLQTALRHLQHSHPILRAKVTSAQPFFFSIPDAPDLHLQSLDASATSEILVLNSGTNPWSNSPLYSLLEHEMNRNPWEEADPSYPTDVFFATVYSIPNSDSSFLALRFHTSVLDRSSCVAVARELLGFVGELKGESCDGGEGEILPAIEDLIPAAHTQKPFWARGRDMLGYSLNFTRSSTLPFADTESARSTALAKFELSVEETRKLLSGCRERGMKLCAALTAAGLIASVSSKHLPNNKHETYSVVTLVDCRKRLSKVLSDHDIGFYHSAIQNAHTVNGEEGLWELATRCYNSFSSAQSNNKHFTDMGDLNLLMLKAIDNPFLTPWSSMRTALISVFEDPVIYDSSDVYQGISVEDYMGCASVHGVGPSIGIFDTVKDGQLSCGCLYPHPLHSREQMQDLADDMKRILISGITAGEGEGAE